MARCQKRGPSKRRRAQSNPPLARTPVSSIFHRRGTAISGTKRDSENDCGHYSPDIASTVPRLCHDYKNMSAGLFGTLPPPWYAVTLLCHMLCRSGVPPTQGTLAYTDNINQRAAAGNDRGTCESRKKNKENHHEMTRTRSPTFNCICLLHGYRLLPLSHLCL